MNMESQQILWSPSESLWSGYKWTCLAGWSAIDHMLLFSSWKITILQSIFMLHDLRVQSKIQLCDLIE